VSSRIKLRNYKSLIKVILFLILIQSVTPYAEIFDAQHDISHSIHNHNFNTNTLSYLFEETKSDRDKQDDLPFRYYVIEDFSFTVIQSQPILIKQNDQRFDKHPALFTIYHSYLI
jgi:hypothetical protein